jgi:hypothetical protein
MREGEPSNASDAMGKKPQKDPRKKRLAQQLRANLQRRKEQARERQSDTANIDPEADAPDDANSSRRDT